MADEEQIVEKVADQIEEVADATRSITRREIGFFFGGVAFGFGLGYFTQEKRIDKKYSKIVDREIADMREHYRKMTVALQGSIKRREPPEKLLTDLGYKQGDEAAVMEAPERTIDRDAEERERVAIHEANDPDWDYELEIASRDPKQPYIIHLEEFRENSDEREQTTLTYYEEDGILADERDRVLDDVEKVIGGLENLRFGHGSLDPRAVHIRNEVLNIDLEIVKHPGSYVEEVHGLKHTDARNHERRSSRRSFDDDN